MVNDRFNIIIYMKKQKNDLRKLKKKAEIYKKTRKNDKKIMEMTCKYKKL